MRVTLVDAAMPIFVKGIHVANIFTGQCFIAPPDLEFFQQQAKTFGFEEHTYLEAIQKVPVISREYLEKLTRMYAQLAQTFADNGLHHLQLQQASAELSLLNLELTQRVTERTEELFQKNQQLSQEKQALADSEMRLRALFENMRSGVAIYTPTDDGQDFIFSAFNQAAETIESVNRDVLIGKKLTDMFPVVQSSGLLEAFKRVHMSGQSESLTFCIDNISNGWRENYIYKLPNGELVVIYDDISERVMAEQALSKSEHRFRSLFEHLNSGFALYEIVTDQMGHPIDYKFLATNPAYLRMTGFNPEAILGERVPEVYPQSSNDKTDWIEIYGQVALTGETQYVERFVEELQCWFSITAYQPAPRQFAVIINDITQRKLTEQQLQLAASVYANTHDGIIITDKDATIVDVNSAFTRITGFSRAEVLGKKPNVLRSGHQDAAFYEAMWQQLLTHGHWSGEIWNCKKDGTLYPEWLNISCVRNSDHEITHYIGAFADISLLKHHEQQLKRMAYYDPLTGIPNRVLLSDRMHQAIAHCLRHSCQFAVCYLDLDAFKPINDQFGHDLGDVLLVEIAQQIKAVLRESDTIARLGGDEFVLLLLDIAKTEECLVMIQRILTTINQPLILQEHHMQISASIGITIFPLDQADPDTLLRHADQAMYQAKQAGKNRFHLYDSALDQQLQSRQTLLDRIALGLEQCEFLLYYQPKVDMCSGKVIGAEALIRWQHPEKGILAPAYFLPIIEHSPLEIKVGEWVIETALRQLEQWRLAGINLEVSVNIHGKHLQQHDFVENLKQSLLRYPKLPLGCLQIEVLETAALEDFALVSHVINACCELGVSFALDDFGTGYSSLTYLRHLPAATIKIDQTFVRDILEDEGDQAIVQSIIALASTFKRQTVAEGVETDEHFRVLKVLGCQFAQGYGIARPMPAEAFPQWYSDRESC